MKQQGPATILAAVVALVILTVAALLAIDLTNHLDANSTPLIATIVGLTGPTIVSLLALLKLEGTDAKVNQLVQVQNGHSNGDAATRASDAPQTPPTVLGS